MEKFETLNHAIGENIYIYENQVDRRYIYVYKYGSAANVCVCVYGRSLELGGL